MRGIPFTVVVVDADRGLGAARGLRGAYKYSHFGRCDRRGYAALAELTCTYVSARVKGGGGECGDRGGPRRAEGVRWGEGEDAEGVRERVNARAR